MRGRSHTVLLRATLVGITIVTAAKAMEHLIVPGRHLFNCLKMPAKGPSWRINTVMPCLVAGFYFYCHILHILRKRNFQSDQQTKSLVSVLANFFVFVVIMATVFVSSVFLALEKCSEITNLNKYKIVVSSSQTIITLGYILLSSEIRQRAWIDLRLTSCIFCRWLRRRVEDRSRRRETSPEIPNPCRSSNFLKTDSHTSPRGETIAVMGIPSATSSTEAVAQTNSEVSKNEIDKTCVDESMHVREKQNIVEGVTGNEGNPFDAIEYSEAKAFTRNVSIITTKALVSQVLPDGTGDFGTTRNAFSVHSTMPPIE
ncbi:uncharacterized protein [Penaeus vannamei]|uniref:uncharacterized protein n=1 Tax=Penaeus vannamei TaxID=6689 RepID=UPI00387F685D